MSEQETVHRNLSSRLQEGMRNSQTITSSFSSIGLQLLPSLALQESFHK
jgi:hypothetical protein